MKMRKKLLAASLAVTMMFTGAISASAEEVIEPTEEMYTTMAMPAGELAGRVFFKENKTTLSFSAKKKIRRVIREIEGDYSLTIKGFARFGETKTRDYLSKSRAMTVKRYLWKLGVDVDIQTVAGWAPSEKGVRDSARRAELFVNPEVNDNQTFDLQLNPLHLDQVWICPVGWSLYEGEYVEGKEVLDTSDYNDECSDTYGGDWTDLPAGTYTIILGFEHDANCESDAVLADSNFIGYWVHSCPLGAVEASMYLYEFELDEDMTITGPIWINEV
jgi:OmpA family